MSITLVVQGFGSGVHGGRVFGTGEHLVQSPDQGPWNRVIPAGN